MEIKWEYILTTNEKSADYDYESPIFIKDHSVYYISRSSEEQVLHIINMDSGLGSTKLLDTKNKNLPANYFFLEYQDSIIIYTDDLFVYSGGILTKVLDLSGRGKLNSYFLRDNKLFLAFNQQKKATLLCYHLDTLTTEWELDITNTKPYQAGELSFYEDTLACYGRDKLLFIEMESGRIVNDIKIPRIDKLFNPIKINDEQVMIGYTNWSNAGILNYNTTTKQVVWRHKRNFEGPQLKCKIYQQKDIVAWVKNNTELICLRITDGEEIYRLRTTPWLYTPLHFIKEDIIFGTAGADGSINDIDIKTGKVNWSVFIKNGCTYYDTYKDSLIVGDFDRTVKQISRPNGAILQNYNVNGEVVGQIKVYGDCVYTVVWGNSEKASRLVKLQI